MTLSCVPPSDRGCGAGRGAGADVDGGTSQGRQSPGPGRGAAAALWAGPWAPASPLGLGAGRGEGLPCRNPLPTTARQSPPATTFGISTLPRIHLDKAGECCHKGPHRTATDQRQVSVWGSGAHLPLSQSRVPEKGNHYHTHPWFQHTPFRSGEPGALGQMSSPRPEGSEPPGPLGGMGEAPPSGRRSSGGAAVRWGCSPDRWPGSW